MVVSVSPFGPFRREGERDGGKKGGRVAVSVFSFSLLRGEGGREGGWERKREGWLRVPGRL